MLFDTKIIAATRALIASGHDAIIAQVKRMTSNDVKVQTHLLLGERSTASDDRVPEIDAFLFYLDQSRAIAMGLLPDRDTALAAFDAAFQDVKQ